MISSIPVGSKVICTNGPAGKLTAVIVDPVSKVVTHIAMVEKSLLREEERLVPIDKVIKTTRDTVELNCSSQDLAQMPDFTRTHYLEIDNGDDGYAYSSSYMAMHPDMTMAPEPRYLTIRDRLVPEGEVAILRGMQVEALDGRVGEVGELILDPQTGQVSHFLLKRGHLWGKKEVALAVTEIERADEDTIYLKMDKAKLEQLPSLPIKRAWDEVFATDLELMAWTYEAQDQAQKTLKVIEELGKTHAIELLNATIIEKDETGEIKIREKKKAASKRRVTLGIALGGLAGLVVGPVALVAGVIGGAVAGKKSARKIEVGFSEEKLRRLNENLAPGGSALILVVEHRWFSTLQVETVDSGGQLMHERLSNLTYNDLVKKLGADETVLNKD